MENTAPWVNDTGELPDLVANDYEIPLLGAFLFYFVQVQYIYVTDISSFYCSS